MRTRRWSTACSRRPATASAGDGTGSTWPAMPTRRGSASRTSRGRSPGAIATTSSGRSTTDKPYDRFLLEQLAGDELVDYEHAPKITPEIVRQPGRDRLPAHGPRLDLGEHHGLPPRPGRGGRRRDRRPRLGRDGAHAQVCPLPHAQVRPHPAPRLLSPGRGLQGGLRRARLAQARDQHAPRAPQRRHARGPAPPPRLARGARGVGGRRMRGCNARSTR